MYCAKAIHALVLHVLCISLPALRPVPCSHSLGIFFIKIKPWFLIGNYSRFFVSFRQLKRFSLYFSRSKWAASDEVASLIREAANTKALYIQTLAPSVRHQNESDRRLAPAPRERKKLSEKTSMSL